MNIKKILFLLLPIFLSAETVEITSKNFEANEKKLISIFTGNVHVKKGKDRINSQKLIIYFNKDKKPTKYEAIKNVTFKVVLDNNKTYEGRAQKVIYIPNELKYIFQKDVFILQKPEMRKIYGKKVVVDRVSGEAMVEGDEKKPVKFVFKIDENSTKGKK